MAERSNIKARCYVADKAGYSAPAVEEMRRGSPAVVVQAFSTDAASNEFFVEMIAAQTMSASATGNLLALKPEIDFLLRMAGTTQISAALSTAGAKKGRPFLIAFVGQAKSLPSVEAARGWRRLPRARLSEAELRRIERAALLNAERR